MLDRRTEMLRNHLMRIPLKLSVDTLHEKYGTPEKQLYRDWERRRQWLPQIAQLNDETMLHQCILGAEQILSKAWLLAEETKNGFVKVAALKLIKDTNMEILEALQSVGAVEKRPIQVDQRILVIKGQWWVPKTAEPQSPPIQTP